MLTTAASARACGDVADAGQSCLARSGGAARCPVCHPVRGLEVWAGIGAQQAHWTGEL
jgi:hypothetical protein